VAKEGEWFMDDNYRGFSKDSSNALVALGFKSGQAVLSTTADIEGTLAEVLNTLFGKWETAEMAYLQSTFQGNADSLDILSPAFNNGLMLADPTPNLLNLTIEVQHTLYSQLVIEAWTIAPEGYSPMIL
jgi:hypothetical protein